MTPDLDLCEAAILAYDDPTLYIQNLQMRILVRHGRTIIGIAGSNGLFKDWIQDAEAVLVPRHGCGKMFDGFADQGDAAHAPFMAYIASFPDPLWFCGHSAGSPLVTRLAGLASAAGHKVAGVQLLACPCPGDAEYAAWYQGFRIPTVSIGLNRDPVCEVYRGRGVPVAPTLWLDRDGKPAKRDWDACAAFTEHPGAHYLRSVRMYLKAG